MGIVFWYHRLTYMLRVEHSSVARFMGRKVVFDNGSVKQQSTRKQERVEGESLSNEMQ